MAKPRAGKPNNSSTNLSKYAAVLMPISQVTALVKGGRLNVIGSPVRRTDYLASNSTRSSILVALPLWNRHHYQATVPSSVNRSHGKNDIILGELQGRPGCIPDVFHMLPFRTGGSSPYDFVPHRA